MDVSSPAYPGRQPEAANPGIAAQTTANSHVRQMVPHNSDGGITIYLPRPGLGGRWLAGTGNGRLAG